MGDDDTPENKPKHHPVLIKELCKGCGFCIEFCPKHVFVKSDEINDKGVVLPKAVGQECVGCRLCAMLCPELAISVEAEEEKLNVQ
jgi:2-oxoglutarate ferredoxin oxidoreductase subunit delta